MKNHQSNERGSALVVSMGVVTTIAVLLGVTLSGTGHNGRMTAREQSLTGALNAADGALEYAYGSWKQTIRNNGLRAPNNSEITIPTPTASLHSGFGTRGVTFSDFSVVNANQWGETTDSGGATITNPVNAQLASIPGHPGWRGNGSFFSAQITATLPSQGTPVSVTLRRTFQLTGVPLFQAAIFFEHDIELHPGAMMNITGLVHSNNSLWLATSNANRLQFLSNVSYVGDYKEQFNPYIETATPPPPNPPIWADGLPASTSTTVASQLLKTSRMEPFGTDPAELFDTTDTNPNNDGPREFIEPPVAGNPDPPEIAAMRFYNQAAVRVAINRSFPVGNANRIVITNGSNAALPAAQDAAIRAAINVSTTNVYDWREGSNVLMTNVDMKLLDTALGGMGNAFNGVFYIQDTTPGSTTAVRLRNGAVLNRDLSVASNNPVYIQGDYNTGGVSGGVHDPLLVPSNNGGNPTATDPSTATGYIKRSTAVMADAVMILSNAWNDANSTAALSGRVASHTTVNTAILSGIVPSNHEGNGRYCGGPHNFPRFLETWSSKDLTYLGSMVQTFNSEKFDGMFDIPNIYSPPQRRWGFDSLFLTKPPPGTVQSLQYSRGRWDRM